MHAKDTSDIISKLEANKYPQDIILATLHVSVMYCNINQSQAIEIACNVYEKSQLIYDIKKPPTEQLGKLLKIILEHSTFCLVTVSTNKKLA